jgi:hypothetical protein
LNVRIKEREMFCYSQQLARGALKKRPVICRGRLGGLLKYYARAA